MNTANRNFWMKNTPSSLDIIYFDKNPRIVFSGKYAHLFAIPAEKQDYFEPLDRARAIMTSAARLSRRSPCPAPVSMRMVMPILLAINRADDVRAAVELHAFGGGDTFKSLGAHTDGGRQSELGAADGHVTVGAAVFADEPGDVSRENPVEPGIGVLDANDFAAQGIVRAGLVVQSQRRALDALLGDEIRCTAMERHDVQIARIANEIAEPNAADLFVLAPSAVD